MKIIFVDDETTAHIKFKSYAKRAGVLENTVFFYDPEEADGYIRQNPVDIAVLDIEMAGMSGIELGRAIKAFDANIKIIYTTGYGEYALDAFGVDAMGYLMKPYSFEDLQKELDKAMRMQPIRENKIIVKTIPRFEVFVDDKPLVFSRKKVKELLALMVDRQGVTLPTGEAIAYLWEDRPDDQKTKTLFRVTLKRLYDFLEEKNIRCILHEDPNIRAVDPSAFACDSYMLLDGSIEEMKKYNGLYMEEYAWAEDTNAKIESYVRNTLGEDFF